MIQMLHGLWIGLWVGAGIGLAGGLYIADEASIVHLVLTMFGAFAVVAFLPYVFVGIAKEVRRFREVARR